MSYRNAPLPPALAPPVGFFRRVWGRLAAWLVLRRMRKMYRHESRAFYAELKKCGYVLDDITIVFAWGGYEALRVYKEAVERDDVRVVQFITMLATFTDDQTARGVVVPRPRADALVHWFPEYGKKERGR